jgi:hypothetical protein
MEQGLKSRRKRDEIVSIKRRGILSLLFGGGENSALQQGRQQPSAEKENGGADESVEFFNRALLEAVREFGWGDEYRDEQVIVIDYINWFNAWQVGSPPGSPGGPSSPPTRRSSTRHALMVTDKALYILVVNRSRLTSPVEKKAGGKPPKGHRGNTKSKLLNWLSDGDVRQVKVVVRIEPSEIRQLSLPYQVVSLENGDEVAQRSRDIVIQLADRHLWLQCPTYEARSCAVEILQFWHSGRQETDLCVEPIPEAELLATLASPRNGKKQQECLIS